MLTTPPRKIRPSSGQSVREETPASQLKHDSEPTNETVLELAKEALKTLDTQKPQGDQTRTVKGLVTSQLNEIIEQLTYMVAKQDNTTQPRKIETETQQRLDRMEKNLENLAQALEKTNNTWAQIAAKTTNNAIIPGNNSKTTPKQTQQKQQSSKERQECEVTLNTNAIDEQTKRELEAMHPKERTEWLQNAINQTKTTGEKPRIIAVNKLDKGLRLLFKTTNEAKQAKSTNWTLLTPGLEIHKPKYGIVIHGVPKAELDITNEETAIKELEENNESLGLTVKQIQLLRRKLNYAEHHSLLVFIEDIDTANKCIQKGILINYQIYSTEKYMLQLRIIQCFNCHGYCHRANECKDKQKCGRYGKEDHEIEKCEELKYCCIHCKGEYPAWSFECQARKEESN